jgi:hypothetical protein
LADVRAFMAYQSDQWHLGNYFTTFAAIFPRVPENSSMESADPLESVDLKQQIESLKMKDGELIVGMSRLERAFLIPELRPDSQRKSRQFSYSTLIFNSRDQFDYLGDSMQLPAIEKAVRRRDGKISGTALPEPGLPEVELYLPRRVLQREVASIEEAMKVPRWPSDELMVKRLISRLKTHLIFMPSLGSTLVELGKNLDHFDDETANIVLTWMELHLEKVPEDQKEYLSSILAQYEVSTDSDE